VICQDEAGRLWDVLYLLALAARRSAGAVVRFSVHVRDDNRAGTPPLVRLKAVSGPGDDGEPVITVMMPDEGALCHDAGPPTGGRGRPAIGSQFGRSPPAAAPPWEVRARGTKKFTGLVRGRVSRQLTTAPSHFHGFRVPSAA
jgi:hypothetical protein